MLDEVGLNINVDGEIPKYLYIKGSTDGRCLWCTTNYAKDFSPIVTEIKNLTENLYILLDICDGTGNLVIGQICFYYSKLSDGIYQLG